MDTAFKTQMAPSLALLSLAALTPEKHRVTLADENVERIRLDDRPDLVGITVKVDTAYRSYEIARRYRKRGVPVILGGIHPTACPEDNLKHADSVVVGEAEEIWGRIVSDAEQGALKPVYRQAGPSDLSASPIPRWELIQGKNYMFNNTLVAGRGCPWKCEFCYSNSPNVIKGHRMKPVKQILAEIESLGVCHVFFIDDNFIGSPARARELLRAMAPLDLTWHTAVSADIGRYDYILDLMAESGCKSLFIGFETINHNNLNSCKKKQNRVEQYSRTIKKIHDRGMMVNASLVFGFDGDGPLVFRRTLKWLVENRVETMTSHILTPYPGTRFYDRLLSEGRITDFDLDHYNTSRAVFAPRGMTPYELEQGYEWIYREFYSLRRIMQRIPAARSQWAAYFMFNFLYRKFGPALSLLGRLGVMGPMARLARALAYPEKTAKRFHPLPVIIPDEPAASISIREPYGQP
jgi:radical SAM superfamily enzyme YgiQ (UPF0313 family)